MNRQRAESGVHTRADLVLVADDSPDTRAVYYGFLDAEGFLVEEAADGLAAIAKAIISCPDTIVLDYSMPRMDGAETVRLLARDRRTRHIPVILVTGAPQLVPLDVRVLTAAMVSKPCDPDEVVRIVRALVPKVKALPRQGVGVT